MKTYKNISKNSLKIEHRTFVDKHMYKFVYVTVDS